MAKCFFELRKQSARGTDSVAADMMRHLHARQHLGKAVIICEQPTALLAASRKQWLKLTRAIQKQRAATLNADKILKYTHTITRMQHMRFSAKGVLDDPEADIYFLDPADCAHMPLHCYSIYMATVLDGETAEQVIDQLPAEALMIDYSQGTPWGKLGLQPKAVLEDQVVTEWGQLSQFLKGYEVDAHRLLRGQHQDIEAMDNALDTLLGVSHQFLRIANEFQRALEVARPLRIGRTIRQEYDSVMLLAYRVQALSPGIYTQHFLETYNEDDTFFLYDKARQYLHATETLAEAVGRHIAAGRYHLAKALSLALQSKSAAP